MCEALKTSDQDKEKEKEERKIVKRIAFPMQLWIGLQDTEMDRIGWSFDVQSARKTRDLGDVFASISREVLLIEAENEGIREESKKHVLDAKWLTTVIPKFFPANGTELLTPAHASLTRPHGLPRS